MDSSSPWETRFKLVRGVVDEVEEGDDDDEGGGGGGGGCRR